MKGINFFEREPPPTTPRSISPWSWQRHFSPARLQKSSKNRCQDGNNLQVHHCLTHIVVALIVLYTHSLYEPSKFGCHETAIPWVSKSKYPSRVSLNTPAQISSLSGTLEVHHCSLLRCGQNLPEASFAPIAI